MARTLTRPLLSRTATAVQRKVLLIVLAMMAPSEAFAHTSELSAWLTLQRDVSGWVGMLEIRVPEKQLILGLNLADLSGDRKVSESELNGLAKRWSRTVLRSLDILLEGESQKLAVEQVRWRADGQQALDVQAKLRFKSMPTERRREHLAVRFFGKSGTLTLAVQTQEPWVLSDSSSVLIGSDRRGFRKPMSLEEGKTVAVDLSRGSPD